ncbi:cyclic nucleotide-binding domain-containing protein [Microcoleus sp. A006_D1]|uniref:Crp/Fnr family transcriptional regulator n=1 Tax=Microcoleus sp. A006_D1 TaxID=3055267 RepID=UPI002FD1D5FF
MPEQDKRVSAQLRSRLYYLTKRYGFTIPYPIEVQYDIDAKQGIPSQIPQVLVNRQEELSAYLRSLPYFMMLDDNGMERLAAATEFQAYGKGELIIREGKPDEGIYIVCKGTGHAFITDEEGSCKIVEILEVNGAFGEMAIFSGEVSPVTVVADEDIELVVIPADEIIEAIHSNAQFATEILQYIEERKKMLRIAKGIKNDASPQITERGRRMQLRG